MIAELRPWNTGASDSNFLTTQHYQFTSAGQPPVQQHSYLKQLLFFHALLQQLSSLSVYSFHLLLDCGSEIKKRRFPKPEQIPIFCMMLTWGDPNWPKINSEPLVLEILLRSDSCIILLFLLSFLILLAQYLCLAIHVSSSEDSFFPIAAWPVRSLHSKSD